MCIGNRLKQIIKNQKLKITEFASICEIPYNSVQNYLTDKRTININAVIKICTRLDINSHWLLTGQGEMYQTKSDRNEVISAPVLEWLNKWWENADEKHRYWLEVQMENYFPEYGKWVKERSQSS